MRKLHEPTENARQFLNSGGTLVNVGQLDKKTLAWLARQTKAGCLVRTTNYSFPNPRPQWHAPAFVYV